METNNKSTPNGKESDHVVFQIIEKKRRLYQKLVKYTWFDAEDLEQELKLKLYQILKDEPKWFEKIENLDACIATIAVNMAVNVHNSQKRRGFGKHDSLDDSENVALHNNKNLSDGGVSGSQIEQEIDFQPYQKQMKEILKRNFSQYEQTLIELNFHKDWTPFEIAAELLQNRCDVLKQPYPDLVDSLTIENIALLTDYIRKDCNAACAKYRQRLKKEFKLQQ